MMDLADMKKVPETIRISKKNSERLIKSGKFGESFDDVITRILDFYEAGNKPKKD